MIIVAKPYVSPLLAETLSNWNIPVLLAEEVEIPAEGPLRILSPEDFRTRYLDGRQPLLTNSENAQGVLERWFADHPLVQTVSIFKDKARFRRWLADVFPRFYYREVSLEDLQEMDKDAIPFPVIVKPAVGYASLGVYRVAEPDAWDSVIQRIERDMEEARALYPAAVLNTGRFIVEEWIAGEEYAIDCYYAADGQPVVLGLYKRMFAHAGDTSDRIYFTGKQVIREALDKVHAFLAEIGAKGQFSLVPLHVEVRITPKGDVVPIEVNPLRFAGIGTADLGYYALGINVYDHFFRQTRPDWEAIVQNLDDAVYSFFCAELPVTLNATRIERIDEAALRSHFREILVYRDMLAYDPTTFAVLFYRSENMEENERLLQLDLTQFVRVKAPVQL